jgi:hypothetical protein
MDSVGEECLFADEGGVLEFPPLCVDGEPFWDIYPWNGPATEQQQIEVSEPQPMEAATDGTESKQVEEEQHDTPSVDTQRLERLMKEMNRRKRDTPDVVQALTERWLNEVKVQGVLQRDRAWFPRKKLKNGCTGFNQAANKKVIELKNQMQHLLNTVVHWRACFGRQHYIVLLCEEHLSQMLDQVEEVVQKHFEFVQKSIAKM